MSPQECVDDALSITTDMIFDKCCPIAICFHDVIGTSVFTFRKQMPVLSPNSLLLIHKILYASANSNPFPRIKTFGERNTNLCQAACIRYHARKCGVCICICIYNAVDWPVTQLSLWDDLFIYKIFHERMDICRKIMSNINSNHDYRPACMVGKTCDSNQVHQGIGESQP